MTATILYSVECKKFSPAQICMEYVYELSRHLSQGVAYPLPNCLFVVAYNGVSDRQNDVVEGQKLTFDGLVMWAIGIPLVDGLTGFRVGFLVAPPINATMTVINTS